MLLQGKKALIMGLANNRSIAYGIAAALKEQGARLAFNYVGEAIKKRVEPLSEELGGEFTFQCDVCDDGQIADAAALVKDNWGDLDILVHSVAFANREDLNGRFLDTSRDGFKLALEVSAFSLTALCRAFEPLLHDGSSVMTMTYHGSTQIIPGYNVMGVAKSALEASVRYLAYDLGPKGVRVNAISSGPIKTLAARPYPASRIFLPWWKTTPPCTATSAPPMWAAPPPSWPRIWPTPSPARCSMWTAASAKWACPPGWRPDRHTDTVWITHC